MTNKRTRFSLKEIYSHLLNLFADTTFLVMKGGQREENFSPVPLEQSNMTVRNSGHSLMPLEVHPDELHGKMQELAEHLQANQAGSKVKGDALTSLLCPSRHGHLQKTSKVSCPWLGI